MFPNTQVHTGTRQYVQRPSLETLVVSSPSDSGVTSVSGELALVQPPCMVERAQDCASEVHQGDVGRGNIEVFVAHRVGDEGADV